jgi:hypothetical protein
MQDWNVILHLLTLGLLGLGGYLLTVFKTATEAAVKTSAEEGAKAAIRERTWVADLARELQKVRGSERQELRFKSYGALWKELRPLAIYDPTRIDNKAVGDLFTKLTGWYFSESGGLLLTPQARDFYFALQDLLRVTSNLPNEWYADRSKDLEGSADITFREILNARNDADGISVFNYFETGAFEGWEKDGIEFGKQWRSAIKRLGAAWNELSEPQRFAVLQQAGSKLRTGLSNDLESRLR